MKLSNKKINDLFAGRVVRKDLTNRIKGNASVPTYVLEYLLGQYCATDDPETIEQGVEMVKEIITRHFVHRDEAQVIKSTIKGGALTALSTRCRCDSTTSWTDTRPISPTWD